jgi:seryl-tRNA synthetase
MKKKKHKTIPTLLLWIRNRCGLKGMMHLDRLNRRELSALSDLSQQETEIKTLLETRFAALKNELSNELQKQFSEIKQNQDSLVHSIQALNESVAKKSKVSELDERIQGVSTSLDSLSDKLQSVESNQKLILLDLVINHADNLISQEDKTTRKSSKKDFPTREDAIPRIIPVSAKIE